MSQRGEKRKKRILENGEDGGAFGALDALKGLPAGPVEVVPVKTSKRGQKLSGRGRVNIVRQTAGRGGKGVTVIQDFKGIGLEEKQALAKQIRRVCGVGGTVKDGRIEIQGDKRDEVKRVLEEAGFKAVFAGG